MSLDILQFLESYGGAFSYSAYVEASFVATGGGCNFLVENKELIPVIRNRVAKLIIVFILDNFGLYSNVSLYPKIIVL